jgi:hypothetical protein
MPTARRSVWKCMYLHPHMELKHVITCIFGCSYGQIFVDSFSDVYSNARIQIHQSQGIFKNLGSEQFGSTKLLQYLFWSPTKYPVWQGKSYRQIKTKWRTQSPIVEIWFWSWTINKLCLLNYWERWPSNKSAQWTDTHIRKYSFEGLEQWCASEVWWNLQTNQYTMWE